MLFCVALAQELDLERLNPFVPLQYDYNGDRQHHILPGVVRTLGELTQLRRLSLFRFGWPQSRNLERDTGCLRRWRPCRACTSCASRTAGPPWTAWSS
jgi:hypothetical protein